MIAMVAASVTIASAQMWVGGSLSWTNTSNEYSEEECYLGDYIKTHENTSNKISFAPEIGYDLNDRWSVALSLAYSHSSFINKSHNNDTHGCFPNIGQKYTMASNSWTIDPYVRYRAVSFGKLNLIVDAGVMYQLSHICGSDDTSYGVGFHINPASRIV